MLTVYNFLHLNSNTHLETNRINVWTFLPALCRPLCTQPPSRLTHAPGTYVTPTTSSVTAGPCSWNLRNTHYILRHGWPMLLESTQHTLYSPSWLAHAPGIYVTHTTSLLVWLFFQKNSDTVP